MSSKTNEVEQIVTYSFTLIELISLFTGIISIILGVFAIWLTLHLKKESDEINKETKQLLTEIKTDSRTISGSVLSEMQQWGNFGRDALTSSSLNINSTNDSTTESVNSSTNSN